MSKNSKFNYRRPEKGRNRPNRPETHIKVRSIRKTPPDLTKLGRAIIASALTEAAADKMADETETRTNPVSTANAGTDPIAAPVGKQEVADDE